MKYFSDNIYFVTVLFTFLIGSKLFSDQPQPWGIRNNLVNELYSLHKSEYRDIKITLMGDFQLVFRKTTDETKITQMQQFYPDFSYIAISIPYKTYRLNASFSKPIDYTFSSEKVHYEEERTDVITSILCEQSSGGIYVISINLNKTIYPLFCPRIGVSHIINTFNYHSISYNYEDTCWITNNSVKNIEKDTALNLLIQSNFSSLLLFAATIYPMRGEGAFPLTLKSGLLYDRKKLGFIISYHDWESSHSYRKKELNYLLSLGNKKGQYTLEYGLIGSFQLQSKKSSDNGCFTGILFKNGQFELFIHSQLLFLEYYKDDIQLNNIDVSALSLNMGISYGIGILK